MYLVNTASLTDSADAVNWEEHSLPALNALDSLSLFYLTKEVAIQSTQNN